MKIFVHGCSGCGVTGLLIDRVRRYNPDVEVINTKYDKGALAEHVELLKSAGMETDQYTQIVVDGTTITRLDTWASS